MKAIIPVFDDKSTRPLYWQLYDYIKHQILLGEISRDEKLPSLRSLSESLNLSITTINLAYSQLNVEGYVYSKPQSGYYVSNISRSIEKSMQTDARDEVIDTEIYSLFPFDVEKKDESAVLHYDLSISMPILPKYQKSLQLKRDRMGAKGSSKRTFLFFCLNLCRLWNSC
jgi:GntR family transcriptional regulator/MocR family aminotransferase